MSVSLSKGERTSLAKVRPGLTRVRVGLGWQARATAGTAYDLDASAFLLDAYGSCPSDDHFVFYHNRLFPQHSATPSLAEIEAGRVPYAVFHSGDDVRGGHGAADNEQLLLDLPRIPPEILQVAFTVTIHDAQARHQTFGQVAGAYIRMVDEADRRELLRYDLADDFSRATGVVFGLLQRDRSGGWRFEAVGQGFGGGLAALCERYGIEVA